MGNFCFQKLHFFVDKCGQIGTFLDFAGHTFLIHRNLQK
jgi:hypothetical protein